MSSRRSIFSVAAIILASLLGSGILFAFFALRLDTRWLNAIIVLIAGFSFFQIVKDKELFLLRVLVFLIPFEIGFLYTYVISVDLIFVFDVILFFLYLNWFLETPKFQFGKPYIAKATLPALLMIGWSSLSFLIAISQKCSGFAIFFLVKSFLIYFYIINRVTTKKQLAVIVNFLIIGLFIQGAMGMAQKLLGRSLGLSFLGEPQRHLWWELARVYGTLGFPNMYGAYLILLLPLSISLFIFVKSKLKKVWYGSVTIVGLFALLFSLSRSSWLGIIGGVIVMLLLMTLKRKLSPRLVLTSIVIIGAIMVIISVFGELINLRFETGGSGQYRLLMIRIAIPIILSHPILGVGLFNYQFYSFSSFKFWHPVHNEYLRLAAETGLPGLFFFLWFVFWVLKDAYKALKFKDKYLNAIAVGIFGGYTAFLTAVMFGPEYQQYRQKFIFWILAGLAVALKRIYKREVFNFQKSRAYFKNNM